MIQSNIFLTTGRTFSDVTSIKYTLNNCLDINKMPVKTVLKYIDFGWSCLAA